MKKSFTFKKIIPSILIVTIFSISIFSAFGVGVHTVSAQTVFDNVETPEERIVREATEAEARANQQKNENIQGVADSLDGRDLPTSAQVDALNASVKELTGNLNVNKEDSSITGCNILWGFSFSKCFSTILASAGEAILEFFGFIVGVSGKLLNFATDKTVLKMGIGVKKIGAVEEGWKIFRDLANIIIIFVLLTIGIATILRYEKYGAKKLLAGLIAVAILINFSLFFTNVVIDSSNLLALQFYNKIEKLENKRFEDKAEKNKTENKKSIITNWSGFGDSYMQAFKLSTLYNNKDFSQVLTANSVGPGRIFLITIFGSVLFLVAAFSFLAGAFLLISRYVVLIFLMILSPVAVVGMVLPATRSLGMKWLNMLFKNAFFAPVYFLLTWFVIQVINSPAFAKSLGLFGDEDLSGLVNINTFDKSVELVLSFIIVIFFIIGSLLLANWMGIKGSTTVIKWGGSARKLGQGIVGGAALGGSGRILRNTAGRLASKLSDSEKLKERASSGGIKGLFGKMQLRGLRGVAGSSFDVRSTKAGKAIAKSASLGKAGGKGGYQEKLKQQVKKQEEFAASLVESKKSRVERIDEVNIRNDIDIATKSLSTAEDRLKDAKMRYPEGSKEIIDAEVSLTLAKENKNARDEALKDFEAKLLKRGTDRQKQYAEVLESERTLGTLFTKVPRKNKEASDAIRKSIKNFKRNKNIKDIASVLIDAEGGSNKSKKESDDESDKET